MRRSTPLAAGLLAALLVTTGCQRLDFKKDYSVDSGTTQAIAFDPPRYDQKLTITAKSSAPVSVFLVRAADENEATRVVNNNKTADIIAQQTNSDDITLEAKVQAKTTYAVVLQGVGKKAEVHLTVTGR